MAARRRRNRKKQDQGMGFPAPLALGLVVGALVALSYLWLCGRCEDLGRRILVLENRKAELESQLINEKFKWTNMTAPKSLDHLLSTHGLVMAWPSEDHVVRLPMSAVRALDRKSEVDHAQYARRGSGPK